MKKQKILITGASGFIGRNLAEGLKDTYDVVAPTSKQLNLLDYQEVEAYFRKRQFDQVIHCATHNATVTSSKNLSLVFYNNVRMFFILARCHTLYRRMFYFGSGADYDIAHYIPKMKEEYFNMHVPDDNYGFSKYIMSTFAGHLPNIYDLRIFGCFGKYEDWRIRFISNAICKAMYGMDITMRQNVYFDYLYVDDLVNIVNLFLQKSTLEHHHYNVCTGARVDLLTLAKIIRTVSGKDIGINIGTPGLKPEYTGDNSRLLQEFPTITFTSIERAISELYAWYTKHKKDINRKELLADKHH